MRKEVHSSRNSLRPERPDASFVKGFREKPLYTAHPAPPPSWAPGRTVYEARHPLRPVARFARVCRHDEYLRVAARREFLCTAHSRQSGAVDEYVCRNAVSEHLSECF